jgi:transposase
VTNELSDADSWRDIHEETRRRYDRELKISIVAELEGGKTPAQIAREHGIHPSLPVR